MLSAEVRQLRVAALAEGVSYVVLLGIAMPLKYLAGLPDAVKLVGMLHGVLFMIYVALVLHVGQLQSWSTRRIASSLFAALLPWGPFLVYRHLADEPQAGGTSG